MAEETSIVSKISMRTIGTNPAKAVDPSKPVPIAIVLGRAGGVKVVVDKARGDSYEALAGMFEATNLQTGAVFQSGMLYLPQGIHSMVQSAVEQLKNPGETVDFALEIRVVKADNPAGYSYQAAPLIKASVVDPLDGLRSQLPKSVPAVESGKGSTVTAVEKGSTKK